MSGRPSLPHLMLNGTAIGQVANFKTGSALPVRKIKDALNSALPKDILVASAQDVPLGFDSQRSAA